MLVARRVRKSWPVLWLPTALFALIALSCSSHSTLEGPDPGLAPEGLRGEQVERPPAPRRGTVAPLTRSLASLQRVQPRFGGRPELEKPLKEHRFDPEEVARLWADPDGLARGVAPQDLSRAELLGGGGGPDLVRSFASIDITRCCDEGGLNPPDPEIAAGSDHVIAVVNASLEIYEKNGTSVLGPMPFETFFFEVGLACEDFPFDPNVAYDEEAERYIVAVDGSGDSYCVAVSATSDPLGAWHFYNFPTDIGGAFFDFPHVGVGRDAIYMAGKLFPGSRALMWAYDKVAMYAGLPADFVSQEVGAGTMQPLHLHGAQQGTWPTEGPHFFALDGSTVGRFALFSWDDPFGIDAVTTLGEIDVAGFHGAELIAPFFAPQAGGGGIAAGDGRVLDFEYRNGFGWLVNAVGCRQGDTGFVDCVQWAQLDLETLAIADAGVFGSPLEFRTYPDLAVDHCDGMAVGYSKFTNTTFPATAVAGRDASDPAGTMSGEVLLKEGEALFLSPSRWGDYTGMAVDPDGITFWYLGEYAKDAPVMERNWGTYIGAFALPGCSLVFGDGFESGDASGWSEVVGGA